MHRLLFIDQRIRAWPGPPVTRIVPATAVFRDANEADKILGFDRVTERAVTADYLAATDAEEWLAYLATAPVASTSAAAAGPRPGCR